MHLFLSQHDAVATFHERVRLAIYLHLRYQEVRTHQRVTKVVILLWVFSLSLSLVALWSPINITTVIFAIFDVGCLVTTTFLNYKIYLAV